ncbi:MAG: UDP-3-O-(3-hydroxymyristoyl)glucosamine N-acyltransferase [Vicinamibacterales bacterium]|nr:UDP-3-O-(3-hydroxymyristoyl)glucosamine N-acyltransferase [Vicinamibacterales bacterium]
MTLQELASRLGCRLEGDGRLEVDRVAGLEQAGPGDLTFLANPKYTGALAATRATAVIAAVGVDGAPCAVLRADNPYLTFARAAQALLPDTRPAPGVHPLAAVAPDATIGEDVAIGPFVVIGAGARIGDRAILHPHVVIGPEAELGPDCLLYPHVSIRERCRLGARVILQNGAVVGSDGFGFAHREDGTHEKIPQAALVVIEDDVEIGANSTIDRPAVGETRIKSGTKIDNLVQIAHGVVLGRNVLLAAQVGIAGSTVLEDNVMLGGQVGVTGHITLGRGAMASAQSGVTNSLDAGAFVTGYPAIPNREWRKASVLFRKLPDLRKRVAELEARLAALETDRRGGVP